ncbi:hypothetical protein Purlil1_13484 [Purpureocillium lilacinum]|uniref:Uncharacterized protein n=1 Tax=Purpureocillium lilacinum TaxID=33203 RepID=A0ABR0BDX6_PURLI|nr:hypothetical protein Purlil1_13484 [Purpureocillium lilacinum]
MRRMLSPTLHTISLFHCDFARCTGLGNDHGTATGSHACSGPFEAAYQVPSVFADGPCGSAPKRFSSRRPADRYVAGATATGVDAIAHFSPTLHLCCSWGTAYIRAVEALVKTQSGALHRCQGKQCRTRANSRIAPHWRLTSILRAIRPGRKAIHVWNRAYLRHQLLRLLAPGSFDAAARDGADAGVAASRTPRDPSRPLAGNTTSAETPMSGSHMGTSCHVRLSTCCHCSRSGAAFCRRAASRSSRATARKVELYVIWSHIARYWHRLPPNTGSLHRGSGWAARTTNTTNYRDLIVQRQSEWGKDLGTNTVETSRK